MANTAKVLNIPGSAMVVLIGAAGSGKSTFARAHFRATEILSSDFFRGMVSDDEGDQEATPDAFALLHLALEKRLCRGKLCVVDATNIRAEHRLRLLEYARSYKRSAVAIIFETPLRICVERAASRPGRTVSATIVRQQAKQLAPQLDDDFLREGFLKVFRLKLMEQVEIRRSKAASPRNDRHDS
jgi:protein phosphatase